MKQIKRTRDIDVGKSLLIFGDNLMAMKKIVKKYKGLVDLIYIDPPYNTRQTFTMTDQRVSTISREKKGVVAYDDNFTLEEYLSFLEKRLKLLYQLLSDQGSMYLHIDYKIGHYVKVLMDKIFGIANFKNDITRIKSNPKNFKRRAWSNEKDMILFYAKDYNKNIWNFVTLPLTQEEIQRRFSKKDERGYYNTVPLHAPGETYDGETGKVWRGMLPPSGRHWRVAPAKLEELDQQGLIEWSKNGNPRLKKYAEEHSGKLYQDVWRFKDPQYPIYPTEKNEDMLKLIVLQSSNENSIVLDCFCGSGSTLEVANRLGRHFIGVDNSPVAMKITKERLADAEYQYMEMSESLESK